MPCGIERSPRGRVVPANREKTDRFDERVESAPFGVGDQSYRAVALHEGGSQGSSSWGAGGLERSDQPRGRERITEATGGPDRRKLDLRIGIGELGSNLGRIPRGQQLTQPVDRGASDPRVRILEERNEDFRVRGFSHATESESRRSTDRPRRVHQLCPSYAPSFGGSHLGEPVKGADSDPSDRVIRGVGERRRTLGSSDPAQCDQEGRLLPMVRTGKELEQGRNGFAVPPKSEDESRGDPDSTGRIMEETPNPLGRFRIVAPLDPDDRLPTHAIGLIVESPLELWQRAGIADPTKGESAGIADKGAVVLGQSPFQNEGGTGVAYAGERIGHLGPNVPVGIVKPRLEGDAALRTPDPAQGRSRGEPKARVGVRQDRLEGGPGTGVFERP